MSTYVESNVQTYTVASAALTRHLRVKEHTTAGQIVVAADEEWIGTVRAGAAVGDAVGVIQKGKPGSAVYVAGEAIAAGDEVTTGASGKVYSATAGSFVVGTARSAATAANELVTVSHDRPLNQAV